MWLIKKLGSLNFALTLIASLAVLLGVSTFIESFHGTPFAQKIIYNAGWFDIFLSLLWVNIFCSTLTRWPFKKHHIGFVITHIGILILLIGALLSRQLGAEGQMALFEGESRQSILQQGWELRISDTSKKLSKIELKLDKLKTPARIPIKDKNVTLAVLKAYENSNFKKSIVEGRDSDPTNHAIHVTLNSERVGMNENLWLLEESTEDSHSFFKSIGPATIELKTGAKAFETNVPKLLLYSSKYEKSFSVDLDAGRKSDISLKDTDLVITALSYFAHAKIKNSALVDSPDDSLFNPAVQFELRDSKGRKESHTRFLLFPDFATLKGGKANDIFGVKLELVVSLPENMQNSSSPSPSLTFFVQDGKWTYQSISSKGAGSVLPLEKNKPTPTGWMDMTFEVNELFSRAKQLSEVEKLKPAATTDNNPALFISLENPSDAQWVSLDKDAEFQTKNGLIKVSLGAKSYKVPFALKLQDFRKVDYPGTTTAMSYESDVVLFDPKEKITIEKTIQMNKPLDYKGFRIFQSSFGKDPEGLESSVFTIAKNPGITLIYSGAMIILIGVIILFYLHPFFNGKANR